jgi:uncharacterized membrane protein
MYVWLFLAFVLLAAGIAFAVSQEVKERHAREAKLNQCVIIEPVEVFNSYHNGVGSTLWGNLEDGREVRTSPVALILADGKVVETVNGSRYILR